MGVKFYIRTKSNSNRKASLNPSKSQQVSNKVNNNNNNEYKNTSRRNTAPTAKGNNIENPTKRFYTQLSTPSNFKNTNAVTHLKEGKNENDIRIKNNIRTSSFPLTNFNSHTPLNESKNFIRKNLPIERKYSKSTNDQVAINEEEDFKEFNKFIKDAYGTTEDHNNSDREEPAATMNIDEVFNDNFPNKPTQETNWFLKENVNSVTNIDNDSPSKSAPNAENINTNKRIFSLNKPSSRLQRFNNIAKNVASPVRELLPMSKAHVSHSNMNENVIKNPVNVICSNNTNENNKAVVSMLTKQYGPKGLNGPLMQKQVISKPKAKNTTIKAIYNTNIIKKFLNTNKMQINNKSDIKTLTNSIIQHQQQQEEILDCKKNKTLIEIKTKFPNKKQLQPTTVKNQVLMNNEVAAQLFENRRDKRRQMQENAKKVIFFYELTQFSNFYV